MARKTKYMKGRIKRQDEERKKRKAREKKYLENVGNTTLDIPESFSKRIGKPRKLKKKPKKPKTSIKKEIRKVSIKIREKTKKEKIKVVREGPLAEKPKKKKSRTTRLAAKFGLGPITLVLLLLIFISFSTTTLLILKQSGVEGAENIPVCVQECQSEIRKLPGDAVYVWCNLRCLFDSAFDIVDVWNGKTDTYRIFFIPLTSMCSSMTDLDKDIANLAIGYGGFLIIAGFFVEGVMKDGIIWAFGTDILIALHCGALGLPSIPIFHLIDAFAKFSQRLFSQQYNIETSLHTALAFLIIFAIIFYIARICIDNEFYKKVKLRREVKKWMKW